MTETTTVRLRMMALEDVAAVAALESGAHEDTWPATNFERELTANPVARYVVLELGGTISGFAGLWIQADEGHIVNVVVRAGDRGRGYGQVLVLGLLHIALELRLTLATLEVREANTVARALYRDFGFWDVGKRKGYYSDGEDAVIMTTDDLDSDAFARRFERMKEKVARRFPVLELRTDAGITGSEG